MNRTRYHQPFNPSEQPRYYHRAPSHLSHTPYYPQTHVTPYEVYAKPAQPMDLLYPNEGASAYSGNQDQPNPSILGAFTDENGQVNLDKTMTTINQLASTYHQVTPIVKQISSILSAFR